MTVLQFLNGAPFGATDPVFNRDIGFYTFMVPAWSMVLGLLSTLTVLSAIAVGIRVPRSRRNPAAEPEAASCRRARRSTSASWSIVFLVLAAARIWMVQIPELLYSSTGPFTGASYSDLNARRPGLHAAAIVALLGAAFIVLGIVRRRVLPAAPIALIAYVAVGFLGRAVYPSIIQRLVVSPTELTRERPYLVNHIKATRVAWGIDSVTITRPDRRRRAHRCGTSVPTGRRSRT